MDQIRTQNGSKMEPKVDQNWDRSGTKMRPKWDSSRPDKHIATGPQIAGQPPGTPGGQAPRRRPSGSEFCVHFFEIFGTRYERMAENDPIARAPRPRERSEEVVAPFLFLHSCLRRFPCLAHTGAARNGNRRGPRVRSGRTKPITRVDAMEARGEEMSCVLPGGRILVVIHPRARGFFLFFF